MERETDALDLLAGHLRQFPEVVGSFFGNPGNMEKETDALRDLSADTCTHYRRVFA